MNFYSHLVTFCTGYIWVAQNLEHGLFVASKINDYQRIFILQKRGLKCCLWECDALGICLIGWCLGLVVCVNSVPYNTLSHNSLFMPVGLPCVLSLGNRIQIYAV